MAYDSKRTLLPSRMTGDSMNIVSRSGLEGEGPSEETSFMLAGEKEECSFRVTWWCGQQ